MKVRAVSGPTVTTPVETVGRTDERVRLLRASTVLSSRCDGFVSQRRALAAYEMSVPSPAAAASRAAAATTVRAAQASRNARAAPSQVWNQSVSELAQEMAAK